MSGSRKSGLHMGSQRENSVQMLGDDQYIEDFNDESESQP